MRLNAKHKTPLRARKVTGTFEKQAPGLKTGVENDICWSEMGSGFGEPGGTPPPRILPLLPPPPPPSLGGLIEFLQNHKSGVLLFCAMKAWQREQKTTTHLLF